MSAYKYCDVCNAPQLGPDSLANRDLLEYLLETAGKFTCTKCNGTNYYMREDLLDELSKRLPTTYHR